VTTVRQVLTVKGSHVHTIHPKECVFDALKRMDEEDVGSLVVMDGERLVGIITERHHARKVALKGKTSLTTPVSDIMERDVVVSRPDLTIEECIAVMSGLQEAPSACRRGRQAHRLSVAWRHDEQRDW
jgi:CBS domain-containing protein